ncbi:CoA transferase [Streptomyces vinaceusdrappus]|uniref:CoA transferase n=1 Tax=Streptomyces vinaceusdrappus TaxID=67376 RepID=A0ABY6C7U0_9ACTN|nr:CoA transferase [Streptomyces vinaceusdrappus]UXI83054.1 CoA transferase [Streptomyces vinaceusdrappus]
MDEIEYVWSVLGGDAALTARVARAARPEVLEARLPVRALASACVGACALAAAELAARRGAPGGVPAGRVDDGSVAAGFTSQRHLRIGGREPVSFAPLSRLWRTADGWVRTHANYPHHRARLLAALGLARDTEDARAVDAVGSLLAGLPARSVEETVYAAGGAAVALRTPEEWAASEQGRAVAGRPLVERGVLDASPARTFAPVPPSAGALLPATGLRVLDLTRVIAGPVATRTLALLGADVLRVDPPGLPELPDQHVDTGFGKRSATLDLTCDQAAFEELLGAADVVVTGYRPGSLDRFGLSPRALAARRPGLVVARLSAWGAYGPWAGRRGFDSLVQVGTGIAALEGTADRPGALPAQALDHGTGYLLAAGVLRALTEQSRHGGSRYVEVALARTAAWLSAEALPADPPTRATRATRAARGAPAAPAARALWARAAARAAYVPPTTREARAPHRGCVSGRARWGGCGTRCHRSASRADPPTGNGRRAPGARTPRAGCDASLTPFPALPNRTAAENVLMCGMPDRQLFSGTCPDLGELVKISR